jgi:hypothetical protein
MSVQPVTTPTNRHAINQQQMELHLRTSTSGPSTASTIAPATTGATSAAAASPGFCASISAWMSSAIESIRSCCANLPLIGWMFGSTPASTTPPASSTVVDPAAERGSFLANIIKTIYMPAPAGATSGTSLPAIPLIDVQNYAMAQFNGIQTPAAKWEAFGAILNAHNSDDVIAAQYYAAMTPAMQEQFRGEMYRVNGGSVYPAPPAPGGHDHGYGFGDFMVAPVNGQIRSAIAKQAACNLQANPVTTT